MAAALLLRKILYRFYYISIAFKAKKKTPHVGSGVYYQLVCSRLYIQAFPMQKLDILILFIIRYLRYFSRGKICKANHKAMFFRIVFSWDNFSNVQFCSLFYITHLCRSNRNLQICVEVAMLHGCPHFREAILLDALPPSPFSPHQN